MRFGQVGLFLGWLVAASSAGAFPGKVIGVHDGDTITVLRADKTQVNVRLNQIDAPELGQAFGQAAKKALAAMVFGQTAEITDHGLDKYGRTIGTVTVGATDANAAMVQQGYAWAYRKYLQDQIFLTWEANARNQRLGLWNEPNAVPPWEWRKHGAAATVPLGLLAPAPTGPGDILPAASSHLQCGQKRFCKEMTDCAEARYHLTACGLANLDRDGDGVPCENVCSPVMPGVSPGSGSH